MKTVKLDSMGNERLNFLTRFTLSMGNCTGTMIYMMISTYLLFVYTDVVKVSAAYVAVLFLVTRIIDAVLAPAFGIFLDMKSTRWGKYRPYILIIGVPIVIFGILTFIDPKLIFGNISETGKLIYVSVTYILFSTGASLNSIPGNAILPAMTKSLDDKINIGQLNALTVMFGAMIVMIGVTPLVLAVGGSTSSPNGWIAAMVLVCVITFIQQIASVVLYKEKYIVAGEKKERLTRAQMFSVILKNRTALITFSIVFGTNLSGGVRTGVMLYYLKYYFNKPEFMSVIGGVGLIATIAGAVLSGIVCRKIGLKATMIWSQVLSLLTCALAFFAPATGAGLIFFLVVSLAGTFFSGLFNPVQGTMLPSAIDYAEWKFHVNANGFLGAVNGFTQTLAGAVSGALVAGLLGVFGYVPDAAQTGTAIFGLRLLVSIIPAILQIFMFAVIWFDFTEEKQRQMTAELNERRKTAMVESQS